MAVDAATRFLRERGYTWSGRPKKKVDPEQCAFERTIIRVSAIPGRKTLRITKRKQ